MLFCQGGAAVPLWSDRNVEILYTFSPAEPVGGVHTVVDVSYNKN